MPSLWIVFGLLLAGVFWFTALRARELATNVARDYCRRYSLQFLDGTVSHSRMRLVREDGWLRMRREYRFEYSSADDVRREGHVTLTGQSVSDVSLDGVPVLH
jgi:hypothetical protein